MPGKPARFADLLRVLNEHGVEYVLVGALAAVLQGAPVSTFDVDIVQRRTPENVDRLLAALRSLHAFYWEHVGRRLEPEGRALRGAGHHLLETDLGRLDVLGEIGAGRDYEALAVRAETVVIAPGLDVRVLALEAVIETKRETGRSKDLAALPMLEELLQELRWRRGSPPAG